MTKPTPKHFTSKKRWLLPFIFFLFIGFEGLAALVALTYYLHHRDCE